MIWTGSETEISDLAALCNQLVMSIPEMRGDGTIVPDIERTTVRWAEIMFCATCALWGLQVMPDVESPLPQVTSEQWDQTHAHATERRQAVAALMPGLPPSVAAAVSDEAVASVYADLVQAGLISE